MDQILKYFPINIKVILEKEIGEKKNSLEEIRIRVQKPIILKFNSGEKIVRYFIPGI
jgi:stage III sporulation protein SpoIIIAA